jgi:hypothetical protein
MIYKVKESCQPKHSSSCFRTEEGARMAWSKRHRPHPCQARFSYQNSPQLFQYQHPRSWYQNGCIGDLDIIQKEGAKSTPKRFELLLPKEMP